MTLPSGRRAASVTNLAGVSGAALMKPTAKADADHAMSALASRNGTMRFDAMDLAMAPPSERKVECGPLSAGGEFRKRLA
jgi:hypothetical protein